MNLNKAKGTKNRIHKSDGKVNRKRRQRGGNVGRRPKRIAYTDMAYQVANDFNRLRQFINTEIKYNDSTVAASAVSSTATFLLLNGMSLGTSSSTRIGQSVKCQGMDLRFSISGNVTAVQSYTRLLVVYDKQANGAIFSILSLLNAADTIASYAVGSQMRFNVLYDETFATSTAGPLNIVNFTKLGVNQHTEYTTGNAGTIADINSGSIYLVYISDQAVNTTTLNSYIRYWFIDN